MKSFTSVVVDPACFRKTSEMARVKSFDCQLQISNGNECKVLYNFIFIFAYAADSLYVSRAFAITKF